MVGGADAYSRDPEAGQRKGSRLEDAITPEPICSTWHCRQSPQAGWLRGGPSRSGFVGAPGVWQELQSSRPRPAISCGITGGAPS